MFSSDLGSPAAMMLEVAPLDAKDRLAQPRARGVVLVGSRGQVRREHQLNAVAPAVVDVDVRRLIISQCAGLWCRQPAQVDLPVPVAWRAGVVGNKRRTTLRVRWDRGCGGQQQHQQLNKPTHSQDGNTLRNGIGLQARSCSFRVALQARPNSLHKSRIDLALQSC